MGKKVLGWLLLFLHLVQSAKISYDRHCYYNHNDNNNDGDHYFVMKMFLTTFPECWWRILIARFDHCQNVSYCICKQSCGRWFQLIFFRPVFRLLMIYIKHGQGNAAGGGVKKTWREREGCAFQWEKIQFQIARSLSLSFSLAQVLSVILINWKNMNFPAMKWRFNAVAPLVGKIALRCLVWLRRIDLCESSLLCFFFELNNF